MADPIDCGHTLSMLMDGMALTQPEIRVVRHLAEALRFKTVRQVDKALRTLEKKKEEYDSDE